MPKKPKSLEPFATAFIKEGNLMDESETVELVSGDNGRGYPPMSRTDAPSSDDKTTLHPPQTPISTSGPQSAEIVPITIGPLAKKFLEKKEVNPLKLAEDIIEYFGRPASGVQKEYIFSRDEGEPPREVERVYLNPIPQISEFCRSQGLTVRELKWIANNAPTTVGRAMEMAIDTMREYLVRRGLDGTYNAQFTQFVAVNDTGMKIKSEVEVKRPDMRKLAEELEKATRPHSIPAERIYDAAS